MSENPYKNTGTAAAETGRPIRKQLGTLFFVRAFVNVLGGIAFLYLIVEALRIQAPEYHAATATYVSLAVFALSVPISLVLTIRARRLSAEYVAASDAPHGTGS